MEAATRADMGIPKDCGVWVWGFERPLKQVCNEWGFILGPYSDPRCQEP